MSFPTPKRKRHMPQPNLNQDIITKILKRLSVKSLLQFRCVSKAWCDLISSPEFVKLHQNKQSSFRKFITYDRLVLIPEGGFELWGSCNGLLCFRAKPYRLIIWNPSSNGNIKTIPDVWQLGNINIFGFGYDECNDDYKVVYAYCDGNGDETVVLVYTFKHGSWKRSERGFTSGFVHPKIAVFVSGSLNWCNNNLHESDWNWDIISFNLTTETAKPMALPSHEHAAAICISESRGLFFAVSRGFENTTNMAICNAKLGIAHFSENGDILMMVGHQLKLHRSNAKGGKNLNIPYGLGYMVTSYVETLVSPAMIGL
ncbi:PREDICTED: putative F-box protein At3g16210 [Ipomoea nil]|uniref:putative F-box protein At3g16210 n=1 Tax=Ipomoea nil TaxID=35883 RepID=UPI0009010854|nr:PREDICTED: putative F-box protein At3g16210 [Ipomoea nil]